MGMFCCHVPAGHAFNSVYAFTNSTNRRKIDPLDACKAVSAGKRLWAAFVA
jgi:hypothetical protein